MTTLSHPCSFSYNESVRQKIYSVISAAVLFLASCQAGPPEFRSSSERGGDYGAAGIGELDQIVWKWRGSAPIVALPAVAEAAVYVTTADGALAALSVTDGSPIWDVSLGAPAHGPPVLMKNRVLVGTDAGLVAVSHDGTVQWTAETDGPVDVAPLVIDSVAYFGTRAQTVRAVDAVGGTPIWSARTAGPVSVDPVHWAGAVAVGAADGRVYRIDPETGEALTTWRGRSPIWGLAAAGERLVVTTGTRVLALTTEGEETWQFELGSRVETPPTISDGVVVAGTGRGDIIGLSIADGKQKFRQQLDAPIRGYIAGVNGAFYVPLTSSGLQTIDANGERQWDFQTDGNVTAGAVPAGQRLYVVDDAGSLYALE